VETILSAIPSASELERVAVVFCTDESNGSRIELRQQTWGEGVGWFTQSSIALEPHQIAELRNTLGMGGVGRSKTSTNLPTKFTKISKGGFSPRVVHAEPA